MGRCFAGLPTPLPNMVEYNRVMAEGFQLYPERKKNWERWCEVSSQGAYKEYVDYMPVKMDYEAGSRCNFRCTMCLMNELSSNRPDEMTFEAFKKSLDEQFGLVEIKLQGLGEPLLNPFFFKMVEYAVNRKIWVRTTTNGSLLDKNDNYRKLIDYRVGEIQVSIDGATKQTFEKIRVGADFDKIVNNVKMMNTYARSIDQVWRTSCWMLVQDSNVNEMEPVLELAQFMGFSRVTYSLAICSWGRDDWEKKNSEKRVCDVISEETLFGLIEKGKELGIEVTFWMGMDKYRYSSDHKRICNWLFSRAYISADMNVVPCCVVCDPKTSEMGDANDFITAWNGEKYMDIRRAHLVGNIPLICKNCYE